MVVLSASHSASGRRASNMLLLGALLFICVQIASAEILTPPYFNLAQGKKIKATATCGDEGPELYCKLVGANPDHEETVIQGQVCDICDANNDTKKHPPEYAVDGMETWWQSPPLSRGMKYNEVNLTIDLGQEFHVAYVFVRMGNSPRPGLWALEKSTDYGKTFKPWQYFSDSPQDCERYFGKESLQSITRDDSVICSTEYSQIVPLEGGEIPISLLNYRPSANKYFNSSVLQQWTRATNVRLRLLRTKNLLGHLMSVARQDPTVTRRYFYSIKDISIGGRCMCNGHADTCDPADLNSETNILVCRCQHNTCGPQCAKCCPGFEQKKWRISQHWDRFACEPCNCHNHTVECEYDPKVDEQHLSLDIHGRYEGGGVCKNCQHNTEGINCNKCIPTFYRPYDKRWNEFDVCQPCNCNLHYSTGNCEEGTGRCECRKEFNPPNCDSCAYGYFDYPDCKPCTCNLNGTEGAHCTPFDGLCPCKYNYAGKSCEICADGYYSSECKNCECNLVGSVSHVCDKESGNCTCKSKYSGRTCNQCEAGYYNYPTCSHCNCDVSGTLPSICDDVTAQCICKEGFGGPRCDQCIAGYYMVVRGRERMCVQCDCSSTGSTSTSCSADGKCNCLSNFGGKQCDQCSPGYYKYPECLSCNCDVSGSLGSTCDDNGQCHCKPNFDGEKCDRCKEQFYNYPACEECNCDPKGVIASFAGCGSVPAGELCKCKDRVQGRICNDCKPLFWNLQEYNPYGCEECNCHLAGTLGGIGSCDTRTGQCMCKMHVGERQCDQCRDGFYRLQSNNVFGCTECDCDIGGSIDNNCDKNMGQCRCHSRVEGRRCDRPIRAHYFPTLHQFQYELEEGQTPSGPARYRSSEDVFPGYSWKGYVVFSLLHNEVTNVVHISKSSLYRMVLKYANTLRDPVSTSIIITPESVTDIQQKYNVLLRPTLVPQLVTVTADKTNAPAPFVMNPGNWTVTFKTNKEVMIDYFVLIPEAYYEATVLNKIVDKPCVIGDTNLCKSFKYPSLEKYPSATDLVTDVSSYIDETQQLNELGVSATDVPLLSDDQSELQYNMVIEPNGPYILVIEYVTPLNRTVFSDNAYITTKGTVTVRFQTGDDQEYNAIVNLNDCPYSTPCRQVLLDDLSKIYVMNVQSPQNVVYLEAERDTQAGIKSIVAIPESEWHLDYITPRPYCLRRDGKCAPAVFTSAVDSKKVEIESGSNKDRETQPPGPDSTAAVVNLQPGSDDVKVESKVPISGDYMFVLHYYQPNDPENSISAVLKTDNAQYDIVIPIEHCPSSSGCRVLLKQLNDGTQFSVYENFTITFKADRSINVWLDYVLVIATPDFVDSALKESNTLDYTREFISKCAMNHYYLNTNESGFCRDAAFAITAEYNSGTLGCFCDVEGSMDLECNTFGGQCLCRPHVIGRTCSACRVGYYGFPDCKPCHCPPTAICDNDGKCICPKNVEGENCDRCKPFTFNSDVQRGCDECNCNPYGVINNQLQCDLDNGNCACKPNVIGRKCDQCEPGHYAFPDCVQCSCERAGTTDDVCDQNTAQCYCKRHVRGQVCDTCKEEYFNLQPSNPDGCTRCYCFGKTTRCFSSYLNWAVISGMEDWYLANIEANRTINVFPHTSPPNFVNASTISVDLVPDSSGQKVVYFGAPDYYLGKRLTSYGGDLTYLIHYTTGLSGSAIAASDVIIGGTNGYIIHYSVEQPPSNEAWLHSVRLEEGEFTTLDGLPLTREQFVNVLLNVTSIYIRASYWEDSITTSLMGVTLDVAVEDDNLEHRAYSVEQCQCPKAYRGLSCEQCAQGYYRLSTGPHAGFCVPCQCNGHSNECDVNTGVCLNCADNTMGEHCEKCIIGYHGDATAGTPRDCLICACPMPYASNNFAIGCELSENGTLISCTCKPGYGGPTCEYCTSGYYGIPTSIGDYCKPCNCSGNIDVKDPGSCDSINGNCLKCMNNTSGAACKLCAPGFYGDAVFSKNCTACECDEFGMERCDPSTGTCVCRPGVVGERCDRCEPNHWGLATGRGCTPCDCAVASKSDQCDPVDGHCACADGVTGQHCDQCAAGYWNYTKYGCEHCNCNNNISLGFTCDEDGQCLCLPGALGEKCDRCPDRWVLIPRERCMECDSCTDALIFSVEDMTYLLANETQEFKDKADSFFTTQRLNYISNQTRLLRPRVAELTSVDMSDVTTAANAVESGARALLRSAEFGATDSEKQIDRAAQLVADANVILAAVRDETRNAKDVVAHVADLATGLELSQQPKVDSALSEAKQIRDDIADKNLEPKKQQAEDYFMNTTQQLERMNVFVEPVKDQAKKFDQLVNVTRELKGKLEAMLEYIDLAQHKATDAERLNDKNKLSKFENKVMSVTKLSSAAMKGLIDTAQDINNATYYTMVGREAFSNTSKVLDNITAINAEVQDTLDEQLEQIPELKNLSSEALQHARSLRNRADNLRALAERENNNTRTQHAYSAASAYSSIVNEIADAKQLANDASDAVQNAINVNHILNDRVNPAKDRSVALLEQARKALETEEQKLRPNLTKAEAALTNAWKTQEAADDENNAIQLSLPTNPQSSLRDEIDKAERVNSTVKSTFETMSQLSDALVASKDWAQTLPKLADDAQKMTSNVHNLLQNINEMDKDKFRAVEMKQQDFDNRLKEADEKLQKLRELVEQARNVANRIQVSVAFDRLSTLQPRMPDSVDEMSTSTRVSAYFRTRAEDGFLLYLGNPKGTNLRRTKSDDFMWVGIQKGYPYVVMDIGDSAESGRESARITSDKYVADDRWYQVIVDRVGRNVKLSIRENLDNGTDYTHTKEAVLPGQHTIFNLDKQKSKLYVGGVPSEALSQLQDVNFPAFEGQIEELMIGDTPVGLWNFVKAENLKGARNRNKLISSQSGPVEYRFSGRSHVTMSAQQYLLPQKNHILLFFRTYAPDGLIYLVGNGAYFFSIQMQDGRVYLQVSLGNTNEAVILGTSRTYNDGKWHRLDAGRYYSNCSLKVDNENVKMVSSSPVREITDIDTMTFGGNNKGIPEVTTKGFDGCLRQINIDGVNIDFADNIESIGVAYGCQFASLVSLSGHDSYLRYVDISAENLQLTLKFKTSDPNGLLFMYISRTQTAAMKDSISLALVNGKLVLMSQNEQLDTSLSTYNDSQWHVVTVTHNNIALRMVVDDYDYFSTDTAPTPLHILEGVLFIGGVQPGYVVGGKYGTKAAFKGCIADATLNGRLLNLLEPYNNNSVTFGRCGTTTTTGGVPPDEAPIWMTTNRDVLPTPAPTFPPDTTTIRSETFQEVPKSKPTVSSTTTRTPPVTSLPQPVTPRPPPPPQPEPGCALAYDPYYAVGQPHEGYRFGTRNDSRIEYSKLPGRQLDGFDLTITFRTFDGDGGLIFYAVAERDPTRFLAVYMRGARLHLAFNCGGETATVVSPLAYNGTEWHTVELSRNEGRGKMVVDSERVGDASVSCAGSTMLSPPYYYGGLSALTPVDRSNLQNFYKPFMGCLKGLMMNGQYVTEVMNRVNALRCTDNVEDGVYFGKSNNVHSNYLKLLENFKVGKEISISLEVKPRNSTGLLLSVHGKKDFLVLEMLENEVVANVENGRGPFHASFKLGNQYSLCDGNWHKIHVVKSNHVVSVGVDGHFSDAVLGQSPSTDTRSAVYIGGHERPISKVRGVRSRRGFTGCIRNIIIGRETPLTIPLTAVGRNAMVGACPKD